MPLHPTLSASAVNTAIHQMDTEARDRLARLAWNLNYRWNDGPSISKLMVAVSHIDPTVLEEALADCEDMDDDGEDEL